LWEKLPQQQGVPQSHAKPSSFSSYLINVLLQLANKNGIQNKTKKKQ
jgi:hypothetical protein